MVCSLSLQADGQLVGHVVKQQAGEGDDAGDAECYAYAASATEDDDAGNERDQKNKVHGRLPKTNASIVSDKPCFAGFEQAIMRL